tara:strand:+ start:3252 stop:3497 length:246 start_codon:yes stop_codon:yes gene_type:complete
MKKNLFLIVLIVLIILTAISALVSVNVIDATYAAVFIIVFSILKFIGVSFYFMELKNAHIFWKTSVLVFVSLFAIITIALL